MLEIKNIVTEGKNAFDGLISRLDLTEERISELDDVSIESSKMKNRRKIKNRKKKRISKDCGTTTKDITYMQWEYQEKKEKGTEEYLKQYE